MSEETDPTISIPHFTIGDLRFNPSTVQALRQDVIILRDVALKASRFDYAVSLSHVIALMDWLVRNMES